MTNDTEDSECPECGRGLARAGRHTFECRTCHERYHRSDLRTTNSNT